MQNDTFGIYCNGQYCVTDDLYFLKQYQQYATNSSGKINYSYQSPDHPNLKGLCEKYKLNEIAGNSNDDLRRISNVRQWIYARLSRFDDIPIFNTLIACEEWNEWNADIIMELGECPEFKADCATFAAVQTEILLALGYKARWIQCLPIDLRHNESHCISHVFVPSLQKWVIVDAAQDLFYFDRRGIPMNLYEMRNAFIKGEKIFIFSTDKKKEGRDRLLQYWVKNIFRFRSIATSEYGFLTKRPQVNVYLDPLSYFITDKLSTDVNQRIHIHTNCAKEFFEI